MTLIFYLDSKEKQYSIILINMNGVSTTVWLYHLDSHETLGEKATWEQLKDVT